MTERSGADGRTNADKRKAVETALIQFTSKSDREIARQCGVDQKTVLNIRKELEVTKEIPQSLMRQGADGRTISTANIGKAQPKPEPKKSGYPELGFPLKVTHYYQPKPKGYPCWTCGEVLDSEQWH